MTTKRATRAWWVFLHYGFPRDRIKVLNGGWRSWVLEMKDVSIGPSAHHSPPTTNGTPRYNVLHTMFLLKFDISTLRLLDNVAKLIGLDRVQDALLTSSAKFVDTRSYEEYIGARDHGNHYVGTFHIGLAISLASFVKDIYLLHSILNGKMQWILQSMDNSKIKINSSVTSLKKGG